MFGKHMAGALVALSLAGALPATTEASFASRLGARYGGTLGSNASTSTQQLTADPVSVLRGSTSLSYDPGVVSLSNVFAEDGFRITEAYVGVTFDGSESEDLVSLSQFFSGLAFDFEETGYLQVFYAKAYDETTSYRERRPIESYFDDGYRVVDSDGEVSGDNTHTMLFNYLAEDASTLANYRLYADDGSRGTSADYLVSVDDPNFIIRDIEEANVGGALVPLPAAFGPGLIGLAGIGFAQLLRRRRSVA